MSTLRLILTNGLILIGGWFFVLAVALAVTDIRHAVGRQPGWDPDVQAALPNQPDRALARQIHADLRAGGHDYVSFVEWRHKPQASATLHINADGLREHTIGRNNRPDAKSIGFFGGSAMWGIGVTDDDTIPALFDGSSDRFNVTNYGEIAWTSRQSLEQLVSLINQNRMPKVVVFYDGYNDVTFLCDLAVAETLNATAREKTMRAKISSGGRQDDLYADLVAPIVGLAVKINKGDEGVNQLACARDPARAERVAETMVRNWEMAHALVEANGGRFFAFLQPNVFVGHPRTDYLPDGVSEFWRNRDQHAPNFAAVYTLIRAKLAARAPAWASDLTDAFDGDRMLYFDTVHVVPKGNAIIARRMLDSIALATN